MAKPRLHLDADVSYQALQKALLARGHDVTRTPADWMPLDASDRQQLLEATARGRCILTFNIGDFVRLSQEYPEHGGIILTHQRVWILAGLITAVDRLLSETKAEDWPGQLRWLNDWR
jgi:peptidoglycan/xylan/chitin deacetylase (PgdA/CDA1 family)